MIWHDELIGVIHILDDVENRRFTETDQTLLTLIANHAAVAVKNTHLYEGAQQEIAERVQAEDALRRSEERYRTLIHQIPSIVYLDDATTDPPQTQYISPYVKEMLGYTPEEWLEGGFGFWMALIYPEDRERVSNTYLSSLEIEGTLNIEYRLYSKTRQIIWVQDQANVLRDESGKSRTIHGVIHNITEIKQAEQALQESKSTLQAALSSMADAVFISNADGQKLEFNDAFVSFHKFKNRAECSKWLSDYPDILDVFLANGELAPLEMWAIPRALRGETVTDAEYTLRRKDTGETWMGSYNFAPIRTEEGEIVGSVVVAHDITERKQAEKRLRQSRRQLRALTNYQQTAIENERAHIARELHDQFGQLLAGLKMDLSWLARHLEANSERQERFQSMNGLIDEAIDVTRRIASELRPGLLDDLGLFPALEWLISEFERRSDISCTLSLPPEEPDLESDLNTALFRIFQECLTNVSRHAQASRVEARLTVSNDELQMELTDNGRGISKSESQHVNSFGLLGMQERVAQWGGTLQITGKEGKGTTVMVKIPLPAFRQKDVL
jgi:PAS domain S-box-containing protein